MVLREMAVEVSLLCGLEAVYPCVPECLTVTVLHLLPERCKNWAQIGESEQMLQVVMRFRVIEPPPFPLSLSPPHAPTHTTWAKRDLIKTQLHSINWSCYLIGGWRQVIKVWSPIDASAVSLAIKSAVDVVRRQLSTSQAICVEANRPTFGV